MKLAQRTSLLRSPLPQLSSSAKNLQNFAKKIANFPNFVDPNPLPSETLMIRTSSQLVRSSAFHDQLSSSFGSRMARRIPARALSRKP